MPQVFVAFKWFLRLTFLFILVLNGVVLAIDQSVFVGFWKLVSTSNYAIIGLTIIILVTMFSWFK